MIDSCGRQALLVDLYELTMAQAYLREGMDGSATFDLFVRRLPDRNFVLVTGVQPLLELLEELRFTDDDLEYLRSTDLFGEDFLAHLAELRFDLDVDAMPEGTAAFAGEPILRVTGPLLTAQLAETLLLNQVHVQTLLASKAARVVLAAEGRGVVDFGLRRTHGADAGLKGARAYWIAGFAGTSNVLAGKAYGIPVKGTMAHSYVQAHDDEMEAFRRFARLYPETILLVDTYDTVRGVQRVIELAGELGDDFRVRGIRLDSGDLGELARQSRRMLDEADLRDVQIFASSGLDEYAIRELATEGAPIDAFGVGTNVGTSEDAPNLDLVYKLCQLDEEPLLKLSTGKSTLPGVKQVWRRTGDDGCFAGDTIGLADEEDRDGEPLLVPMMRQGCRLEAAREGLETARERAAAQLAALPQRVRALEQARPSYPVTVSDRVERLRDDLEERLRAGEE
jgi:nicotinate phosphoribosyltransferase